MERVQGETALLTRKRFSVHKERMEMKFIKFAFAAVLCALFVVQAEARTLYVDAKRPNNKGNGLKGSTAKKTIQAAINISKTGDTIVVAPGSYAPIKTNNKKRLPYVYIGAILAVAASVVLAIILYSITSGTSNSIPQEIVEGRQASQVGSKGRPRPVGEVVHGLSRHRRQRELEKRLIGNLDERRPLHP